MNKINNKKQETEIKQEGGFIIQHNHLIEAKYHLSLQEKRVMCWLASQVKQTDEDFKEHDLTIKNFAELVKVKGSHLYKTLDTITHKLMKKIITIRALGKRGFIKAALLGGVQYCEGQGIIKLSFHPYLKPYMLQLSEKFTKISIGDILGLKSIHSVRIYELMKQHEFLGKRKILLGDLREYCGINSNQYKRFNDLKKDVLERSRREINSKTDINIEYKEIKESRKVIAFEFCIKKNPNYGKTEFEKSQTEKTSLIQKELRSANSLIEEIMELGFSRASSRHFLKKDSEETVRSALKAIKLQIERGHVRNPKAMFIVAVNEKWSPEIFVTKKTAP
jgi:plasmid replication initiation protein